VGAARVGRRAGATDPGTEGLGWSTPPTGRAAHRAAAPRVHVAGPCPPRVPGLWRGTRAGRDRDRDPPARLAPRCASALCRTAVREGAVLTAEPSSASRRAILHASPPALSCARAISHFQMFAARGLADSGSDSRQVTLHLGHPGSPGPDAVGVGRPDHGSWPDPALARCMSANMHYWPIRHARMLSSW